MTDDNPDEPEDPDELDEPEAVEAAPDEDEDEDALPPWVWRVFRVVDRFTQTELESGRQATHELALLEAEDAARTWR